MTMAGKTRNWIDIKVAAAVLFAAHLDGYIHEAQITPKELKAMKCAGQFLQETDIMP